MSPERDSPLAPPARINNELLAQVALMLEEQEISEQELPAIEQYLESLTQREPGVDYEPEQLLAFTEGLEGLLLQGGTGLLEALHQLSTRLQSFFGSKFVEFYLLDGDELVYEYISVPQWLLKLVLRVTGVSMVNGMRVPLFAGSIFKELVDGRKPRELIAYEDRLRSIKDFLDPSIPANHALRERYGRPLLQLLGHKYVFQVPLIVNDRMIGYFGFLQKRRFPRRVRADIIMLSTRISHLVLLKRREQERRHMLSEGVATLEATRRLTPSGEEHLLRLRDYNPSMMRLLGADQEPRPGVMLAELAPELAAHGQELVRAFSSGLPTTFEARLRASGRTCRFVATQTDTDELILVAQDITREREAEADRRRLEQKMQQAQKLESLGVLAGGIAHDFNNLLMTMLGNADLALLELPPGASEAATRLREIRVGARRAADLATQLLAYAGKGAYAVREIDLSLLVQETVALVRSSVSREARVHLRLEQGLPPISADRPQVQQVVMNLVINASEALPEEGGDITLATCVRDLDQAALEPVVFHQDLRPGTYVLLTVSDTGCGMDPETQQRIFEPFFTTKFTGRGLGLAAAMGIVRAHRGGMLLESRPGLGTCFTVLFPPAIPYAEGDDISDRQG